MASRPFPYLLAAWLGCSTLAAPTTAAFEGEVLLYPRLKSYVAERELEFKQIPPERRQQLQKVAAFVRERLAANQPARLTFICTHNSRRSHLAQIWAWTAAAYYGLDRVDTFSGGTEATAFNPRAVAALERVGFAIEKGLQPDNPVYAVSYGKGSPAQHCFSKVYNSPPNPTEEFCAVMTCSDADENCPVVAGSALRLAIPYEDPKASDGTMQEAATYDDRCAQIAREMLYLMSQARNPRQTGSVPGEQ